MSFRKTAKFHVYGKSYSTTGVFHNSWKSSFWLFGGKKMLQMSDNNCIAILKFWGNFMIFKKIFEEEAKGRLTATFKDLYKETNQGHHTLTDLPV